MKLASKIFCCLLLLIVGFGCSGRKIESLLKKAEEMTGTREFDAVLETYQGIVARYPDDPHAATAYLKMGDLYFYNLNDAPAAENAYLTVKKQWPLTSAALAASLAIAELYQKQEKYYKAIDEYEWVAEHFTDYEKKGEVVLRLAKVYFELSDPAQAAIELTRALSFPELAPETYEEALYDLAEAYLLDNKSGKACETYTEFIKKFPQSKMLLDAELGMVECLEKLGDMEQALLWQEELAKKYPASERVHKRTKGLLRREEKLDRPVTE